MRKKKVKKHQQSMSPYSASSAWIGPSARISDPSMRYYPYFTPSMLPGNLHSFHSQKQRMLLTLILINESIIFR